MILPRCSHRTALMGRVESQFRLPSQALMLASNSAPFRAKNSRASSSMVLVSRRATHWANWFQCPVGVTLPGPSSQYSAMVLRVSSSCLEYWVILSISSTYLPLGFPSGPRYVYGPGGRNWSAEVRAKGVTLAQNGVRNRWMLPVHSVAPGGAGGCTAAASDRGR